MEKVNGWNNWETWNFVNWELDTLLICVNGSEEKEDIETLVETHIALQAESLEAQQLEGVARDFLQRSFNKVDTDAIIEAVWEHVEELQKELEDDY